MKQDRWPHLVWDFSDTSAASHTSCSARRTEETVGRQGQRSVCVSLSFHSSIKSFQLVFITPYEICCYGDRLTYPWQLCSVKRDKTKYEPKARRYLIATGQDMNPESKASFGHQLTTSAEQPLREDFIKWTSTSAALNEKQDVDSNKKNKNKIPLALDKLNSWIRMYWKSSLYRRAVEFLNMIGQMVQKLN